MSDILSHTSDFDCVFARNDRMADGAREVMMRYGAGHDVTFVGVDALPTPDGGNEPCEGRHIGCLIPFIPRAETL